MIKFKCVADASIWLNADKMVVLTVGNFICSLFKWTVSITDTPSLQWRAMLRWILAGHASQVLHPLPLSQLRHLKLYSDTFAFFWNLILFLLSPDISYNTSSIRARQSWMANVKLIGGERRQQNHFSCLCLCLDLLNSVISGCHAWIKRLAWFQNRTSWVLTEGRARKFFWKERSSIPECTHNTWRHGKCITMSNGLTSIMLFCMVFGSWNSCKTFKSD